MEGTIASFRRGKRTQTTNQMIIHIEGVDSKEKAETYVGKSVSWQAPGKQKKVLKGKITYVHGRNGAVRALFETGMPGQSLGTKLKIE
ncbi:MAG: 50S ribosomal protein L35ae [archaeon]